MISNHFVYAAAEGNLTLRVNVLYDTRWAAEEGSPPLICGSALWLSPLLVIDIN